MEKCCSWHGSSLRGLYLCRDWLFQQDTSALYNTCLIKGFTLDEYCVCSMHLKNPTCFPPLSVTFRDGWQGRLRKMDISSRHDMVFVSSSSLQYSHQFTEKACLKKVLQWLTKIHKRLLFFDTLFCFGLFMVSNVQLLIRWLRFCWQYSGYKPAEQKYENL